MSNPNPISYRYNELENWHIESNAMADPGQRPAQGVLADDFVRSERFSHDLIAPLSLRKAVTCA